MRQAQPRLRPVRIFRGKIAVDRSRFVKVAEVAQLGADFHYNPKFLWGQSRSGAEMFKGRGPLSPIARILREGHHLHEIAAG
ncbi:hypothetical protein [Rhodoblastus sp.]|uniref:hypothetical protein n=1 Tax=Rhodoblastus sp. TaxID=1962975 RepID=UPI0026032D31|nr:hypothetical protein [Rhodoblastus sp.]